MYSNYLKHTMLVCWFVDGIYYHHITHSVKQSRTIPQDTDCHTVTDTPSLGMLRFS